LIEIFKNLDMYLMPKRLVNSFLLLLIHQEAATEVREENTHPKSPVRGPKH
jgi:hypothetical protein